MTTEAVLSGRPDVISRAVTACGLCQRGFDPYVAPVLDLGYQPLAEDMRAGAPRYPLRLLRCKFCDLVQLDFIVNQREVFKPDHTYSSGNSNALHAHFQALADELRENMELGPNDVIVDIGANDGTFLSKSLRGFRVGIEPTNQINGAISSGRVQKAYREFFTSTLAGQVRRECGEAKLVTATNVLAHVPDPHDFLEGVKTLLADDGVFVTENHDVQSVLDGQIDTVYHEHIRYYSRKTLRRLLEMHDFEILEERPIPTHGGSFRTYARKKRTDLQGQSDAAAKKLREMLEAIPPYEHIYGIGATTRASTLIHFAKIQKYIECVCEVSISDKLGKVMPGTEISIVDEECLFRDQPAYAVLFSWHMADVIIPKLREKGYRGHIIVPLPEPRVLGRGCVMHTSSTYNGEMECSVCEEPYAQ
jgi:hypothetical protein